MGTHSFKNCGKSCAPGPWDLAPARMKTRSGSAAEAEGGEQRAERQIAAKRRRFMDGDRGYAIPTVFVKRYYARGAIGNTHEELTRI